MRKFEPVAKPIEGDFYTILEDMGVKYIHINGYTYESSNYDYKSEKNPDGIYWANLEVSWFIFPLAEFIANLKENENFVDDTYCELNQYQGDLTEEEMIDTINHYFDGHGADAYLSFGELTMDTPCGNYIN